MADTNVTTPARRPRRRWLRVISFLLLFFILLLAAAYFVGTSAPFLKAAILPRVSKSLHAEITVSDASISPFKEVVLHNLKVKTTGEQPLLDVPLVRAHYSLMDIIRGNIKVDEVTLTTPTIVIVENPDGSKNTDPLTNTKQEQSAGEKPGKTAPASKSSKPPQIDIKKITLTDGTIRQVKLYAGGKSDVTELSHLNLSADGLKNGQSGKLTLNSDIKVENHPPAPGTNGALQARLSGDFTLALSADLKPASIQGATKCEVASADGNFAEFASFGANVVCEVTPTEVKQVALQFAKGTARLGEVRVSGPFEMEKKEGKLTVQLVSIDKQVLNLFGAKSGLDFGTTKINSTNEIQISKAGTAIAASGQLNVDQFQVTREKETTPTLDLLARYNVSVDQSASNAVLRELTIKGVQKDAPLLLASLTSPMNLNWGNPANGVGDSSLNLAVTNLNLADWKPFVGNAAPSGIVNVTTKLDSKQGGQLLNFDFNTDVANLTVMSGTNRIADASVNLHATGNGRNLNEFTITEYRAQVSRQNQPMVNVSGAGTYNVTNKNADFQANAQAIVPRVLQALPQENQTVSSGTVDLKVHLVQKEDVQSVTGTLALNNLTARFGSNEIRNFNATLDLDVGKNPSQIELRRISGKLTQDGKPGGEFDLTGTLGTNKAADIKLSRATFNQDGLRPLLQGALGDKQLASVAVTATATIQYDPQGSSVIKADAQISNLVVKDPKNQIAETPLEAKLAVDTAIKKQVADINKFLITLTPTQRARNELQITGHFDFSNTNYTQGSLKLSADAIDVTSYYDIFAGNKQAAAAKPDKKAPKPATTGEAGASASATSSSTEKEPDPKKLPVHNFTFDANIGHFYIREVDVAEFQTQARIDVSHVVLNAFKLKVNGGPANVTADIDLSVPGFKYAITAAAQTIPLPPIVNSFMPEQKGQIGGTLGANAKLDGAGVTGSSLKKSLSGNFDVVSTNLNISIDRIRNRLLKTLINVVAAIPELASNPTAALGAFTGKGGLTQELSKSPIEDITARGTIGAGKVNLEQGIVESKAFRAEARGDIALADVLTNSVINIPVAVSLSHALADNFGLAPADTPTNAAYAKLPDFVTMRGTLGDPKTEIKKGVLYGTAFKGVGSIVGGVSGKYGGIIKDVGGILTGSRSSTNAPAAGTNPPATNQTPAKQASTNKTENLINNALDLFNRKKKQ